MNRAPAFQFYADDFIGGTVAMTNEERGLYILLLCLQWTQGGVSGEDAERLGLGMAKGSLGRVLAKFVQDPRGGLLKNERLESERLKQADFRKKQAENGKLGGRPKTQAFPKPNPAANPEESSPSPSPKTIDRKTFKRPTIEEIQLQCAKIGLPETEGVKFEAHHEARGWRYKTGPMKSWQGALTTWKMNWESGAFGVAAGPNAKPAQSAGQPAWKQIRDLEEELKQLNNALHEWFDRDRNPDKVKRREEVKAELAKLKAIQ
jgi:uncharacterized protein YdaU (DUF1376 family)